MVHNSANQVNFAQLIGEDLLEILAAQAVAAKPNATPPTSEVVGYADNDDKRAQFLPISDLLLTRIQARIQQRTAAQHSYRINSANYHPSSQLLHHLRTFINDRSSVRQIPHASSGGRQRCRNEVHTWKAVILRLCRQKEIEDNNTASQMNQLSIRYALRSILPLTIG